MITTYRNLHEDSIIRAYAITVYDLIMTKGFSDVDDIRDAAETLAEDLGVADRSPDEDMVSEVGSAVVNMFFTTVD